MSDITPPVHKQLFATTVLFTLVFLFAGCQKTEEGSGTMVGPSALNNIFQFYAKVDQSLTASCGTAAAPQSSSTSSGSGSGSGSGTSTNTTFNIASNYYFADNLAYQGQQMVMRYVYSQTRHSYSLSIANTATGTCNTVDGIVCNGAGTASCPTTDGVNCGGTSTFIFSIRNPAMIFTASVGTIDWSDGFSLTTDESGVNNATLKLNMSAADGTLFIGKVTCISDAS